jgi:hypothetical protein
LQILDAKEHSCLPKTLRRPWLSAPVIMGPIKL